jgi:hypothetical protein
MGAFKNNRHINPLKSNRDESQEGEQKIKLKLKGKFVLHNHPEHGNCNVCRNAG